MRVLDEVIFSDRDSRGLRRAAERGELRRIGRGSYVEESEWEAAPLERRHLLKAQALERVRPHAVFSHETAAVLLGLPVLGLRLASVHVTSPSGRSSGDVIVHRRPLADEEVVTVGGLAVTHPLRTVTDIALLRPLRTSLIPLDHALRSGALTTAALQETAALLRHTRGGLRLDMAFGSADARSESPGESLSRGVIIELGFPLPELQVTFGRDRVDFDWPEYELCGEFDGQQKYSRSQYTRGRSPEQIVISEKQREDGIRLRVGRRFARWDWSDAHGVVGLRDILLLAGLPRARKSVADIWHRRGAHP